MAKDAEAHASEDKEQRDKVEARNSLDSLVYNVEKMIKDGGEKVAAADKVDVEAALAEAKKTLGGEASAADLNASKDKLTAASHKLAEVLYKAAAAEAPAAGATDAAGAEGAASAQGETKKDEGVIDAEYVDVDK
jgi:molecular chaperone DnaK